MSQILNVKETPLSSIAEAIERNKNNPAVMLRAGMEVMADLGVDIVDPTSPTVLLLEFMSAGYSSALAENRASLRRTYQSLAETPEDLADHISDWDFANMFASPSVEPFDIFISLSAFRQAAVRDEAEKCYKVIIPRDTEVLNDGKVFTLHYPIVLRYYDLGNLEISYDATVVSNFQSLETNIIPNKIVKRPDESQYIMFRIPLQQVEIVRNFTTTTSGQFFLEKFEFTNQFYYARAWYRNASTSGKWTEMVTTHGRMNYDRRNPTMLLAVSDGVLECRIPQIYMTNNRLLGEVAVDIYTTLGEINERMGTEVFQINFRNLDPSQNTIYTPQALSTIQRWASPVGTLTGGKNGLTFEQRRERIIYNATGPIEEPITQSQLGARAENNGFTIAKNVDMVTSRIFHGYRKLPSPTTTSANNERLITNANIGIQTFVTSAQELEAHELVYNNPNRSTISPRNLYEFENGILRLLPKAELDNLSNMETSAKITRLNNRNYLFSPFHYVLDSTGRESDMRAYYLDKPEVGLINFQRRNSSMQLIVNTSEREIVRTTKGYEFRIKVLSGNFFKELPDSQVSAQIRFSPKGDDTYVYILGTQVAIDGGERIFAFEFETDYDINSSDALHILNGSVNGNPRQSAWIDLETEIQIFICSNNVGGNYEKDAVIEAEYAEWLSPNGFRPITHEATTITFGHALKNLWRRMYSHMTEADYKRHEVDVLAYYETDIYEIDPITGSQWKIGPTGIPTRTILHVKGDPVLDEAGNQILKHQKGDVVFEFGEPVVLESTVKKQELDLLLVDGRHYFVDDQVYLDYNQELVDIIVDWITEGLEDIQDRSLDKTKVFYYPRTQIGNIRVERGDSRLMSIPAEQTPLIDVYLRKEVIEDPVAVARIKEIAIRVLDEMLGERVINSNEITNRLRTEFGGMVGSFKLYGFGPNQDIHYAKIIDDDRSLSLKRLITAQGNGKLIMTEGVTIKYMRQ